MTDWTPHIRALSAGAAKEIRQLLGDAEKRGGWTGRRDAAGHIRLRHEGGAFVSVGSSVRTRGHSFENTRAAISRAEKRSKK